MAQPHCFSSVLSQADLLAWYMLRPFLFDSSDTKESENRKEYGKTLSIINALYKTKINTKPKD